MTLSCSLELQLLNALLYRFCWILMSV
ncbi:hypothetical protein LINGRAHAP2_LOCUS7684 [Linum grandiflorum]